MERRWRPRAERRLAFLLALLTIPAALIAFLLDDLVESGVRQPGLVALMLVLGAAILWLADRWGPRTHAIDGLTSIAAPGTSSVTVPATSPGTRGCP